MNRSILIGVVGVIALSSLTVGTVAVSGPVQQVELPDEITIETVAGQDADQMNELDLGVGQSFDVTIGGVDEFHDRYTYVVRIDGEVVRKDQADSPTVPVRITDQELAMLEEGGTYELEVALELRGEEVSATTQFRVNSLDTGREFRELPDEIRIETVDGQDANQINDVELVNGGEFEFTVGGVDEFVGGHNFRMWIDGVPVGMDEADDSTVQVSLDEELQEFEPGETHELKVALNIREEFVNATTQIRFTNLQEVRKNRSAFADSNVLRVDAKPSGIPLDPQPTQEIRLDVRFPDGTEPSDVTATVDMFGEKGLPDGMEVTDASASSSAWQTTARPTSEGLELEINAEGGPESGKVQLTVNFDANEVYEADAEVKRGIRYRIDDPNGESVGQVGTVLWGVPFHVVVETPDGERLTPNTDRENWEVYYRPRSPPFDPDIDVFIGDKKLIKTGRTVPSEDGVWRLTHRDGRYLRVDVDGYADPAIPLSEIDPTRHLWRDNPYVVQLSEGGQLDVSLSDHNGDPLPDGYLELEDQNGIKYSLEADDDGVVREQLKPGEYTGFAAAYTALPEGEIGLSVNEEGVTEAEYTLTAPEVVDSSVEHIGGTEPDVESLEVDSMYYEGAMIVSLKPQQAEQMTRAQVSEFGVDKDPHDVSDLGVDETTELRVTLEFEEFEPNSLIWAARDANWEVVESTENRTVVEIETKAANLQKIDDMRTGFGDASTVQWPTGENDVADEAYGAVVEVWLWDLEQLPGESGDYARGVSVMTNAQIFSVPEMEDGELSIYMAAPSKTVDGQDHTGYYQAYLSDGLLENWNVDDPQNDLEVMWAGEREQFTVEDAEDGVYIEVEPVHFSDGEMEVRSLRYESDDGVRGSLLGMVPLWVIGALIVLVLAGIGAVVFLWR